MKLAVCSNKPHPAAVKVIAQLFDGEFDMVVGQSEAIRRKPAPDGPLMVAEKFGVKDVYKRQLLQWLNMQPWQTTAGQQGLKL